MVWLAYRKKTVGISLLLKKQNVHSNFIRKVFFVQITKNTLLLKSQQMCNALKLLKSVNTF